MTYRTVTICMMYKRANRPQRAAETADSGEVAVDPVHSTAPAHRRLETMGLIEYRTQ